VYDVIIIGAGPAGSIAAHVSTRLGLKALVIDRQAPPREKPCGGGLTPRSWKLLNRLGLEYPIYGVCKNIKTIAAGYQYQLSQDPIYVTRRPDFDYTLFKQSGADFIKDQVVKVVDGVVKGRSGEYSARVVIGADGATSAVARSIGVVSGLSHKTHGIAYMTIAKGPPSDTCLIDLDYVLGQIGELGYAWVFPLGEGANVGVGMGWGKWRDLRNMVVKFAERHGYRPSEIYGHPLALGYVKELGVRNILLAGEAAGLVDATTGEGIYYAVASGAAAATAAYIALKIHGHGKYAHGIYKELVKPYVEEVKKTRWISLMAKYISKRKTFVKLIGKRLVRLYQKVYTGEATYSLLLKPKLFDRV